MLSRGINNANVLALGVNLIAPNLGCDMAEAFLKSEFLHSAPKNLDRAGLKHCFDELVKIDHDAHNQQ